MANIIKVDTSKLRSASSEFSTTSGQIKNATTNMTQTVSQLSGTVWSGEAASSYVNKFTDLNDEIMRIDNMIKEHVQELLQMADEYDRAEDESKAAANALPSELF